MNSETWTNNSQAKYQWNQVLYLCKYLICYEGFRAAYPCSLATKIVDDKRVWRFFAPTMLETLDTSWFLFKIAVIVGLVSNTVLIIVPFDTCNSTISQAIIEDLNSIYLSVSEPSSDSVDSSAGLALMFYEFSKSCRVNCCLYEVKVARSIDFFHSLF